MGAVPAVYTPAAMPDQVVFLHSSNDTPWLQELERHAQPDLRERQWHAWIDEPARAGTATLHATATLDEQIRSTIEGARAVVFCIGRTGPGGYQQAKELPWIVQAMATRRHTDRPLSLVPVLLPDGDREAAPPWMLQFPLVNEKRLTSLHRIWMEILLRLEASPAAFVPDAGAPVQPHGIDASWTREITRTLGSPANLTLFIGPYAPPDDGDIGPAAMTESLLEGVNIDARDLRPLLPWPSESAEWLSMGAGRHEVEAYFMGRQITALPNRPSRLTAGIAALAHRWAQRFPRVGDRPDWNGLLMLSTRVDLALEAALIRQGVPFTRFTPTAEREPARRENTRRALQHWRPMAGDYHPDPQATRGPWTDVPADTSGRRSFDAADPVLLVKLCGSIDIDGSLVVTVSDLFQEAQRMATLPEQVRDAIQASPQLLVGRGFASPLGQLMRANVLGTRLKHQRRVLVMPLAGTSGDSLCDLELRLLEQRQDLFQEAMELTAVRSVEPTEFLKSLAEAI